MNKKENFGILSDILYINNTEFKRFYLTDKKTKLNEINIKHIKEFLKTIYTDIDYIDYIDNKSPFNTLEEFKKEIEINRIYN